jgi:hypothetical protein
MKRAQRAPFEGFDAVHGVVHRTGRASGVKNIIYFAAIERLVDVNLAKLKTTFVAQMM